MTVLLVALGAAIGAPLRYLAGQVVQTRHDSPFPWGTWTVNLVGSLLLGLLAGGLRAQGLPEAVMALLGAGFCGALTTYSTFGYETVRLAEGGAWWLAMANIVAGVGGGLGAALCGAMVAGVLWG
ncbi:MAG: fluoride efflux transporter CrcB [Dactylosporangium sp.]|nr:fluoride efflux transporter CrcB [Dactylosporangium sp.]NNJ60488.1 fluoride efflux transporter CrcB [Dactylosporangium sp.]